MKEEKEIKNRKWVIRIAVSFMAAMLLLLFFSNTIYNYSLPQVTVVYTSPGQMTTAIRETGVVEAMKTTKVLADGTHTIQGISATLYEDVTQGAVLVTFKEVDLEKNEELKAAQAQLDELLRQEYTKNLQAVVHDYTMEERMIADALDVLNEANATLTQAQGKAAAVSAAQTEVDAKKIDLTSREAEMSTIKMQEAALMAAYGTAQDDFNQEDLIMAPLLSTLEAKKAILTTAQGELDTANEAFKTAKEAEKAAATALQTAQQAYDDAVKGTDKAAIKKAKAELDAAQIIYDDAAKSVTTAQEAVDKATTARDAAQVDVSNAQAAVDERQPAWDLAKAVLDKATADLATYADTVNAKQAEVDAATQALMDAEAKLNEANSIPSVEDATDLVESAQRSYDDANKTLADKKKQDGIQDILDSLTDEDAKKAIEKAQKSVEDLKTVLGKTTIVAPVSGRISQINITEGMDIAKGDVLMVIDEVSEGYKVNLSFTTEQVTKGQMVVGMGARDAGYSWGGQEDDAYIVAIKPDSTDPKNRKKVTFKINPESENGGWYSTGQSITLTMNNRSQNYQCIVPLAAVHIEASETFVYTVKMKSSPLGDRYVAIKVLVTIIASDDKNAAINPDALSEYGSQVITQTNDKSFQSGDQVRLAED